MTSLVKTLKYIPAELRELQTLNSFRTAQNLSEGLDSEAGMCRLCGVRGVTFPQSCQICKKVGQKIDMQKKSSQQNAFL